jgi:hypothetical protein
MNSIIRFSYPNASVRQIWILSLPGKENTEGYIVISLTYNETKVFHWRSPTSRSDGVVWSGELDIDDITDAIGTRISTSEQTLATGLSNGVIFQITPTGVYSNCEPGRSRQDRIVQASVLGDDIALVTKNEAGSWSLLSMNIKDLIPIGFIPDSSVSESDTLVAIPQDQAAQASLGQHHELEGQEPTALKLFLYR